MTQINHFQEQNLIFGCKIIDVKLSTYQDKEILSASLIFDSQFRGATYITGNMAYNQAAIYGRG